MGEECATDVEPRPAAVLMGDCERLRHLWAETTWVSVIRLLEDVQTEEEALQALEG